MNIELYVYDLSRGMARSMSKQFLGIQLDAVYHTSLVFAGIEYLFGAGVQTCAAGSTHHGRPMEVIPMGTTHLPLDTILEYLESLKQVYTPESYDLFAKNCNNFTNDFAMFLVGRGIPAHITSLPQRVLDTPFGQMLKPQLEAGMRSVTQTPVPAPHTPSAVKATPAPPHPHALLSVPTLQHGSLQPTTYAKPPPLAKLMAKLGPPTNTDPTLLSLKTFIAQLAVDPPSAPLPNLPALSTTFRTKILSLPLEQRFPAIDLLRCSLSDARMSGFFAEEPPQTHTIVTILQHVTDLGPTCPHNLRLVTLQLACNLSTSPLHTHELLRPAGSALAPLLVQLVTSSLLDAAHPTTRCAASWLAFNLSTAHYRLRRDERREALPSALQVELAASLIESLGGEDNSEAARAQLLALGYLAYCAPLDGEVLDLAKALDAQAVVMGAGVGKGDGNEALAREVASLL
ncbi:hypothetical protein LTR08_007861 [Meristemomyces frigidus]|nr:hypothetical protein LTR08_007861 [Meristemomyces frigidus]